MSEIIREDKDYYYFQNNNRFSKMGLTKEEVIIFNKSLFNCKNCIDCTNCKDCVNCHDCTDCTNCVGCVGCTDCNEIIKC